MQKFLSILAIVFAISLPGGPAPAGEPGWRIDQYTNAQGNMNVSMTARAIEIVLPKQKYRIYSAAPNWNVVYINEQIGNFIDFPHDKFMGSIMGRLGNQLGNDIQMLALPKPNIQKEGQLEYATYDRNLNVTDEQRRQLKIKGSATVLYAPRSIKAKYLRLANIPKEPKELVCKVSCVPMSFDYPISFNCLDGFKENLCVLSTTLKRQEKSLTISPPSLKGLKRVNTEHELFSHVHVNDVFELFGDTTGEKNKTK